MDAEEASRLLAERRRLARIQKEQEDKLRQEEERCVWSIFVLFLFSPIFVISNW